MLAPDYRQLAARGLSPREIHSIVDSSISGITMKGRRDVVNFVSGVSTRVNAVNIISTAIDFPVASGVWQMTTTQGVQYTLHMHHVIG